MPLDLIDLPDLTPDADWSVAIVDAASGGLLAARTPDRLLKTASVGKIFLLLAVAQDLAAGVLDPAEPLTWSDADLVEDSGLWQTLHARILPLTDLATLVGAVSDNLATNVLLRRVGLGRVTRAAREAGCAESGLLDRVRDERLPGMPPTLSLGRADELAALLAALHRGDAGEPGHQVLAWLARNTDLSMVAAAFDLDPLAHADTDRGVRLVNKTGTISTVRADVGLVSGPAGTLSYAVLANWADGTDARDAVLADQRAIGVALRAAGGA